MNWSETGVVREQVSLGGVYSQKNVQLQQLECACSEFLGDAVIRGGGS